MAKFIADIKPELADTPIAPPPGGGKAVEVMLRYATDVLFGQGERGRRGPEVRGRAQVEPQGLSHERHLRAFDDLTVDKAKTPEEKRRQAKEAGRDNKAGYLFLLPWLIGLVVITIGPMLASLYLSFTNYNLIQAPKWIGLEQLRPDARRRRGCTTRCGSRSPTCSSSVPLQLSLALGIALLLDEGMRGLPFYRSVFYLPSMLGGSVAIALLWRQMFGTDGLVNQVLRAVRHRRHIGWISDPSTRCGRSSCCTCGRSARRW